MAPREHQVELLELRRRRQDDVGVVGGVGEELLADHREQVVAGQSLQRQVLVRGLGDRVAVVDEQGLDRRVEVEAPGQRRAQLELVDNTGAGPDHVGAVQPVPVDRERPQRKLQQAAADVAPGADEGRQAGDRADGLAAAGVPLDGDPDADRRRRGGGVLGGQGDDVVDRDAGDLRRPLRRVLLHPLDELVVADRVVLDVVGVDETAG